MDRGYVWYFATLLQLLKGRLDLCVTDLRFRPRHCVTRRSSWDGIWATWTKEKATQRFFSSIVLSRWSLVLSFFFDLCWFCLNNPFVLAWGHALLDLFWWQLRQQREEGHFEATKIVGSIHRPMDPQTIRCVLMHWLNQICLLLTFRNPKIQESTIWSLCLKQAQRLSLSWSTDLKQERRFPCLQHFVRDIHVTISLCSMMSWWKAEGSRTPLRASRDAFWGSLLRGRPVGLTCNAEGCGPFLVLFRLKEAYSKSMFKILQRVCSVKVDAGT